MIHAAAAHAVSPTGTPAINAISRPPRPLQLQRVRVEQGRRARAWGVSGARRRNGFDHCVEQVRGVATLEQSIGSQRDAMTQGW